MFTKIGDWFRRIMYSRYGTDKLNMALLVAALLCSILSSFVESLQFLSFLSTFLIVYVFFRIFSKNITARRRELSAFTCFVRLFTDRTHRYFVCPGCGQTVRVPRGKGKISIRCPRCAMRFDKKT